MVVRVVALAVVVPAVVVPADRVCAELLLVFALVLVLVLVPAVRVLPNAGTSVCPCALYPQQRGPSASITQVWCVPGAMDTGSSSDGTLA